MHKTTTLSIPELRQPDTSFQNILPLGSESKEKKTISYFHTVLVPGEDLPGQDVTGHTNHTSSHSAANKKHYHQCTGEIHQI